MQLHLFIQIESSYKIAIARNRMIYSAILSYAQADLHKLIQFDPLNFSLSSMYLLQSIIFEIDPKYIA